MAIQQQIGDKGELLAAQYLQKVGYSILERNYRNGKAEIDLICKSVKTLVFVEVKTRTNNRFGNPEAFVNKAKATKVIEGANGFIHDANWNGAVRFDIISILLTGGAPEIKHFKDAFY